MNVTASMLPTALASITEALEQHKPQHAIYALFSGGHDSLTATHVASKHPAFRGVLHVNTGIGVEQTREFVRETCREHGWPLTELEPQRGPNQKPESPSTYREMVLAWGFPGPAGHGIMYQRLKQRQLERFMRETRTKRGELFAFVSGARAEESSRRMRSIEKQGAYHRDQKMSVIWLQPIHDWAKSHCNLYIEEQALRRSIVVDTLHMSGECLCGAFARPGELDEIRLWYPETAAQIDALQAEVVAAGQPACRWGVRPPNVNRGQQAMPLEEAGMLCTSCVHVAANDPTVRGATS